MALSLTLLWKWFWSLLASDVPLYFKDIYFEKKRNSSKTSLRPPSLASPFYRSTFLWIDRHVRPPLFFSGKLLDSIISIFLYIVFIIQYTLHSSDTCLSGVTSLNLLLLHSIYKLYTHSKIGNSRNTWPYVLLLLMYYNYYYIWCILSVLGYVFVI